MDDMKESMHAIAASSAPVGNSASITAWLDSFSSREVDEAAFANALASAPTSGPDACWEIVSLVDQYFRRGKLSRTVYERLKAHFQAAGLERESSARPMLHGVPVITTRTPPAAIAAASSAAIATASSAAIEAASSDPAPGMVLRGRYRLTKLLGEGRTGTVFEAIDQSLPYQPGSQRALAIKICKASGTQQEGMPAKFRREFQQLQMLSHPNIVRVHDFDTDRGTTFFTMELLQGTKLDVMLREHANVPMDRSRAFSIIREVCGALAYARSRGAIHAPILPQNIFITAAGEVRLSEFSGVGEDDLAPMACLAYTLLTGTQPFDNHGVVDGRTNRRHPPRPAGLSRGQWEALDAGLFMQRRTYPADWTDWAQQLDPDKDPKRGRSASAQPRRSLIAVAAIALVAAAAAVALLNKDSTAQLSAGLFTGADAIGKSLGAFLHGVRPEMSAPAVVEEAAPQTPADVTVAPEPTVVPPKDLSQPE